MTLDAASGRRSVSPTSSGRSSPVPRSRRAVEDGLYKTDKSLRRYAAIIERALGTWETAPQEWADYIAFLARLLKAIQSRPKDAPVLPNSRAVASKLAQCLNPALPSGVHQKALEVYAYIFSTFGVEFLSAHLHEYLPGLSSVLSFASLSVRPSLYVLFEQHVVQQPSSDLRPALKSLILALLPAIEEETSEDFDRAFAIVESLERKFDAGRSAKFEEAREHIQDGFFWQCLFLCVITSPSRRLGALNYLARRLPVFATRPDKMANGSLEVLSDEAKAVTSPEPGLVVRCFVAGLSDPQMLIQRGFLDLLVTHLPLHSPVLQKKVESQDLDLLVSAAMSVLLRRDMSLNRRLWTWFLGPDPMGQGSPTASQSQSVGLPASTQISYFEAHGKGPLQRCQLAMFTADVTTPAQKARPFRICLSLMDRWEIGSSLVPCIFLPALRSFHAYSFSAPTQNTAEVLRSASLFFDGVEANLIWMELVGLLRNAFADDAARDDLHLFQWVLDNFNMKDEEMLAVHIPLTALYLLTLLNSRHVSVLDDAGCAAALRTLAILLEMIAPRTFAQRQESSPLCNAPFLTGVQIRTQVDKYYTALPDLPRKIDAPFESAALARLLLEQTADLTIHTLSAGSTQLYNLTVPAVVVVLSKVPVDLASAINDLHERVAAQVTSAEHQLTHMHFPTISATASLMAALLSKSLTTKGNVLELAQVLISHLWYYLAPTVPKYHVEAVKTLWQLDDIVASEGALKASLLAFMRRAEGISPNPGQDSAEAARRFVVLWDHTVPPQPNGSKIGAFGLTRKGSAAPIVSDAAQLVRRLNILSGPLLLALDALHKPATAAFEAIKDWIADLPSLDNVFAILLHGMRQSLVEGEVVTAPDRRVEQRRNEQRMRYLVYYLELINDVLTVGNDWTWECLVTLDAGSADAPRGSGALSLTHACVCILSDVQEASLDAQKAAIALLETLISSPAAVELVHLELDSRLLDRLILALGDHDDVIQGSLLHLIPVAMKLRLSERAPELPAEHRPRGSLSLRRVSNVAAKTNGSTLALTSAPTPPPLLLQCIRMGFTSRTARFHMDQWLSFLSSVLPTFADAIFASLIPLVECFCVEIDKVFGELLAMTKMDTSQVAAAPPDSVILGLLEGLEMILARAHDSLMCEGMPETPSKTQAQPNGFLGSMASGVFRADGPPSKTAQANSRLTVILAFQDSIRACLGIWTWSNHPADAGDNDTASAATTSHNALRLRNKTRYLLEQMFSVEPLESLEVVMARWRFAPRQDEAAATLTLLQVVQGSRPKNVVPAILDALCSRTNPAAMSPSRHSSQTVDITPADVALFLLAFLEATEDDAMDEIWADCVAFLRDVLANPLPYRQVLPALLSLVHLLTEKIGNTNFGEQRKMRRELGDIFQRLLTATFTSLPSGYVGDHDKSTLRTQDLNGAATHANREATKLVTVLKRAVIDLDIILETPERATAAVNTITISFLSPALRAKSFPEKISLDLLRLLLEIAKKAPAAKAWRKELGDVFNDARLLASPVQLVEIGWLPVLHQWCLRDRDRMTDLLSRVTPPSSAGIMFGVGASAARLEADRKTQLNLRRICLLLLASPEDAWVAHLRDFDEKLVELSGATRSSSPSSAIKAELFMLCMALVLSLSPIHLSPLWPSINDNLQAALTSLYADNATEAGFTNLGLLQACKLLDQLVALSPDEFQLHEWLYIVDTVDAVYRPDDWTATALSDQIAEVLGAGEMDANQTDVPPSQTASRSGRCLLLGNQVTFDKDDVKALPRDELGRAVLRPFLNQLSIHAYEGVYSMEQPDAEACRHRLLQDMLDLGTIVE
ncbi:hypothetical protein LTR85_000783 [Meristemomyces frigidus]|nr:hypothetical protein LTR85_000783 [Meristemomyces frigidus]